MERARKPERWLDVRGGLRCCAAASLIAALFGCGETVVPLGADRPQEPAHAGMRAARAGSDGREVSESRDGGGGVVPAARDAGMREQKPVRPPCGMEPLAPAAGETCYDFRVHGVSSPTDTSPFTIWAAGELYSHFYYAVPWPSGSVATAYGVALDEPDVTVHAWAFDVQANEEPGAVHAGVLGTLIAEDAIMIGAWAAGACNVRLPADVGLALPGPDRRVLVEWHHYNEANTERYDTSAFRICTAPRGSRANLASLTWLGTDDLNGITGMGPGMQRFGGRCTNGSGSDITIVRIDPHMHRLGVGASATVWRAGGGARVVLDRPFQFEAGNEWLFEPPIVLGPGDVIESVCTYDNTTSYHVPFGPSLHMEMCFQFAIAYPARALDNGVASLIGVKNACW